MPHTVQNNSLGFTLLQTHLKQALKELYPYILCKCIRKIMHTAVHICINQSKLEETLNSIRSAFHAEYANIRNISLRQTMAKLQ